MGNGVRFLAAVQMPVGQFAHNQCVVGVLFSERCLAGVHRPHAFEWIYGTLPVRPRKHSQRNQLTQSKIEQHY